MFILLTNHFNDLQCVYLSIMEFKTFPYLKTINYGYEIYIGKSWCQKPYIWLIKHVLIKMKFNILPYLENHLFLWKFYIHNHALISHAYINHTNKSHVCLSIPYSCWNHDSKHNRTWNQWKYIQFWKGICLLTSKA